MHVEPIVQWPKNTDIQSLPWNCFVIDFLGLAWALKPQPSGVDRGEHAEAVTNNSCNSLTFILWFMPDAFPALCQIPVLSLFPGRWSTAQTSSPSAVQSWGSATSCPTPPERSHCHQTHLGAGPETPVRREKERQRARPVCEWRLQGEHSHTCTPALQRLWAPWIKYGVGVCKIYGPLIK